jgi:hypothetical protein
MKRSQLAFVAALSLGALPALPRLATAAPANAVRAQQGMGPRSSEDWRKLAGAPGDALDDARRQFRDGDKDGAAEELEKSAAYLRLEASRAGTDDARRLERAARRLDRLASSVERGEVNDVGELERDASKASGALARHHLGLARELWDAGEKQAAGHELRAASSYLTKSSKYRGGGLGRGAEGLASDTKRIGDKLVEGAKDASDEAGAFFGRLGRSLERTGKHVFSKDRQE